MNINIIFNKVITWKQEKKYQWDKHWIPITVKEQTKNYSLPSINVNISEQQILEILNVISAIKKDKFFENKLKEIWFKNDHLYVRIKTLELDVRLGNQNKINDKLKMLKGFYIYKSKKILQLLHLHQ